MEFYILILILLVLLITTVRLELLSTQCIEKGCKNNTNVRINVTNFMNNPFEEISRYVTDVKYYSNVWRISAICSTIITILLLIPIILSKINIPIWLFFPFTWILIFTVCYNVWNFKTHHLHDFIYKSITDSMTYLNKIPKLGKNINKLSKKKFNQTIHP